MQKKILMVAAENDALPGAKVGGVGDVIRDLPLALARQKQFVDVVIPSYGFLSRLAGIEKVGEFGLRFGGADLTLSLLIAPSEVSGVRQFIIHHPEVFSEKGETVYCNDDKGPFATDATKFALFSAAVAEVLRIGLIERPDVIHCHDWHSAFLLVLLNYGRAYADLKNISTVYTIHNLAMQGIRPLRRDKSSMMSWYPDLTFDLDVLKDLRYGDCVNPMRAGILLADKVHTVSPTYAEEILKTSSYDKGIYGGEGLENELKSRADAGQLLGVINGCEYPQGEKYSKPSLKKVSSLINISVERWMSQSPELKSCHWLADKRVEKWSSQKQGDKITITSVGRITDQKLRLLQTYVAPNKTALEAILEALGERGSLILLGSGDSKLEDFLLRVAGDYNNLIFLNGYSDALSKALYKYGDLFLMPSSFEPCGISQMLALRAGQPCLVNSVGGLKDTVFHLENGYCFSGADINEQAQQLLIVFKQALEDYFDKPDLWKELCSRASATRFTWDDSAKSYLQKLYV